MSPGLNPRAREIAIAAVIAKSMAAVDISLSLRQDGGGPPLKVALAKESRNPTE